MTFIMAPGFLKRLKALQEAYKIFKQKAGRIWIL